MEAQGVSVRLAPLHLYVVVDRIFEFPLPGNRSSAIAALQRHQLPKLPTRGSSSTT